MTFPIIRVVELFSGIGAQASALERAGIPHECVAVCEIDKYAYASYCAIHGNVPNLGDITKVKHLPECDLLTYSFPCTDLSMAGKRKGMTRGSGTRSSLLWEVERLLLEARSRNKLPTILQLENVPALVNKKNIRNFSKWIDILTQMGYTSSYKIINSKAHGIAQNRARCFMVSCLDGIKFEFPEGYALDNCLKDFLEKDVDPKYYLSQKAIDGLILHKKRHESNGNGFGFRPLRPEDIAHSITAGEGHHNNSSYLLEETIQGCEQIAELNGSYESTSRIYSVNGCSPAINTCQGGQRQPKILVRSNTSQGYIEDESGDGIILDQPNSKTKRGRVQKGMSPTIMTSGQVGVVIIDGNSYSIRRLTPRECWRLMGFTDDDFDRVKKIRTSDAQLYKQAGNSIVVDVLVAIFDELYNTKQRIKQPMITEFEKVII